ncbi:orf-6 [Secundilactobacillus malefermentans DSM 5705 = KCTC 3548]|uniref:DUF536 domain-containing protein n=1 Tax=Secundilactobacillus malefermentans TaxID=176292 RepID=UPI0006F156C3|nr:DUF536 domain-containing protein [Secundilactobacillus malefermentans]KRM56634.1 orf-6 [Secundilactobacillus malefermentans DSM 5705 = KCTC 3548]
MTIKELADELGVSKQAIRKHLEKLPPTLSVTKKGNTIYLNTDVSNLVRKKVTRVTSKVTGKSSNFDSNQFREDGLRNNSTSDKKTANNYDVEKILNEQLKVKDKQLAEKDKQIQTMQKLLDQQQQLSLQTNKHIEQLQLQLSNETTEDSAFSTSNPLVNDDFEKKGFLSRFFKKRP